MRQVSWTSAVLIPLAATPVVVALLWLVHVPLAPLVLMMMAGVGAALLATRQAIAATDHSRALQDLRQAVESGRPEAAAPLPADLVVLRDAVAQTFAEKDQALAAAQQQIEQLQAERAPLDTQLQQVGAALDEMTEAAIVTDALDEIVAVNAAAADLLNTTQTSLRRQRLDAVSGAGSLADRVRSIRQEGVLDKPTSLRLAVGEDRRPCDVRLKVITCPRTKGRLGVVTVLEPETALTTARRQDSDLVACVSHELRTPLSSIRAYIEMLMDGEATDELSRSQFYQIIDGETHRLMRLIDNVLGLNRVEAGLGVMQMQVVDLASLVSEAFELLLPQARAHRLDMTLEPMPLAPVLVDRDLIVQAMSNLLGNAIKYTPEGGRVTVSLAVDEQAGMAEVQVTDTGVGIPESHLPHVFERFYRVGDHRRLAGGTGLGLALVRQVIESLHSGQVGVRSEVDRGSTFTFSLPIAEEGTEPGG